MSYISDQQRLAGTVRHGELEESFDSSMILRKTASPCLSAESRSLARAHGAEEVALRGAFDRQGSGRRDARALEVAFQQPMRFRKRVDKNLISGTQEAAAQPERACATVQFTGDHVDERTWRDIGNQYLREFVENGHVEKTGGRTRTR